ncbi:hypothetical protein [Pendulispora albinea]|uniref:Uncharacterized protein n=1 Tax=Pendulispora albinea TaxID=2741071 RepID=A0ABZ2MC84_9BACT
MRPRVTEHSALVAIVLGLALLCSTGAQAREPSHVLIVREGPSKRDPLLAETYLRVASELRSAGFDVGERTARRDDDPRAEVEAEAPSPRPSAAAGERRTPRAFVATILIRRTPLGTDIWIADHVTHKTVLRKIEGQDDPATLAMRVLELMRASLIEPFAMESQSADPPPDDVAHFVQSAPIPPTAPEGDTNASVDERPAPRVFLDVGLGLLWSGPDLGLAVAPTVSLAFPIAGPFRLGVFAMAPAFGATVRAAQGVAHLRQELGLAELTWSPRLGAVAWLQPRAAAGLGVYHLRVDGDAREPYRDGHDATWAFLTSLSAGGSLALSRTARIALDGRLLMGFPRPVVRFVSEDVGSALRPSLAITTALEVDL